MVGQDLELPIWYEWFSSFSVIFSGTAARGFASAGVRVVFLCPPVSLEIIPVLTYIPLCSDPTNIFPMNNRLFPILSVCLAIAHILPGCSGDEGSTEPEETDRYSFGPVSPNPMKDLAELPYSIAKKEHVLIRLYALDGEVLDTLLDEERTPGDYVLTIDAGELENAMYAVRFESDGWVADTQFIVQR